MRMTPHRISTMSKIRRGRENPKEMNMRNTIVVVGCVHSAA